MMTTYQTMDLAFRDLPRLVAEIARRNPGVRVNEGFYKDDWEVAREFNGPRFATDEGYLSFRDQYRAAADFFLQTLSEELPGLVHPAVIIAVSNGHDSGTWDEWGIHRITVLKRKR